MPIGSSLGLLLLIAATFACPDKDEFCIFCGGNKCLHCAAAYLSPEGQCIEPGKKVTNCATYSADGICKTCRFRYSVDKDGNCQPITLPDCFEARDANFSVSASSTCLPGTAFARRRTDVALKTARFANWTGASKSVLCVERATFCSSKDRAATLALMRSKRRRTVLSLTRKTRRNARFAT